MIINQSSGSENLKAELTKQDELLLELEQVLDIKAGGSSLPILTNPATEDKVLEGYEYIDAEGNKKTGNMVELEPVEYELIEVSMSEGSRVSFTLDRVTGIYGGLVKESNYAIPGSPISSFVDNKGYCLDGTNKTIRFTSDKYFMMSTGIFNGDYKFMVVNDPNKVAIFEST